QGLSRNPGRGTGRSGQLRAGEPDGRPGVRDARSAYSLRMSVGTVPATRLPVGDVVRARSLSQSLRSARLLNSKGAVLGLVMLAFLVLAALIAPLVSPFDPIQIDPSHALYSPGLPYVFGTDQYGRDIFSRVIFGTLVSLIVGPIAVSIALLLGVTVGLLAGFYGTRLDAVLMRIVDIMLAFPGILLALAIVAVLGSSLTSLMIAVGISSIPTYARLT